MFWAPSFCVKDNNIWFVYGDNNVLLKCNLENGLVTKIDELPLETEHGYAYYETICFDNKIYLIPGYAKNIICYDLNSNKFKTIKSDFNSSMIFRNAYLIGNRIYAVPAYNRYFICINAVDETIKKICDWGEGEEYRARGADIADSCLIEDNTIIAVIAKTNKILVLDLKKNEITMQSVGDIEIELSGVFYVNETLYVCDSKNGYVIEYDYKNQEIKGFKSGIIKNAPYKAETIGDSLIILTRKDGIDVEEIKLNSSFEVKNREIFNTNNLLSMYQTCSVYKNKSKEYYFDFQKQTITEFCDSIINRVVNIKSSEEVLNWYVRTIYEKNSYVRENNNKNLNNFIKFLLINSTY